MKPGRASKTAELGCLSRAVAHRKAPPSFDDPTALAFLPEEARRKVERARSDAPAKGIRERWWRAFRLRHAQVMAARTVAIDTAVREAAAPQLVIVGAGLD